jgi:hypothetical protein
MLEIASVRTQNHNKTQKGLGKKKLDDGLNKPPASRLEFNQQKLQIKKKAGCIHQNTARR